MVDDNAADLIGLTRGEMRSLQAMLEAWKDHVVKCLLADEYPAYTSPPLTPSAARSAQSILTKMFNRNSWGGTISVIESGGRAHVGIDTDFRGRE